MRRRGGHGMSVAKAALLAAAIVSFGGASAAQAASVAYIEGGEVWLSSLDGAAKVQLSAGEGRWLDVAQADGGRIIGVQNEPGKVSQLSRFTVWEPNGAIAAQGPLPYRSAWAAYLLAAPLSVDLTPDGGAAVFGYSASTLIPAPVFDSGFIVMPFNNVFINTELTRSGRKWPTLVGNRVIGTNGSTVVRQDPLPGAPYTEDFTNWFTLALPAGATLHRTDVAANASAIAWEVATDAGPTTTDAIDVAPLPGGLGADPGFAAGCRLQGAGSANEVSLSQDGTRLAWHDDGGVKVAGIPVFTGADACQLSTPPVVISPTGRHPSIGGADAAAIAAARAPGVTGGSGAGTGPSAGTPSAGTGATGPAASGSTALAVTVPKTVTTAALRRGLSVTVTAPAAGPITVELRVARSALGRKSGPKTVVIARGTARATKAGKLTVRLKLTKTARARLRRLRGKTATLKITAGTRTITRTVKLR